jgi:hypothetical protein
MRTSKIKKMKTIILIISLIGIIGCEKDDSNNLKISTGIVGNIKYGEGGCMPIIVESAREYKNYNGDLYFIVKTDLDNLGDGDIEQLKANSIKTVIKNGKLAAELPPGYFVIMPSDVYYYSDYNTIVITEGDVLLKEFKFWKCTSY